MSSFKVTGCFLSVTLVPFGDEIFRCWMISAVAECGVLGHVALWVILPAASLTPFSPPSLPPSCLPPYWELCNTLKGCQERGMNSVYVCVCMCVMGVKDRLEYIWELKRERQRETYPYKPLPLSSSFIHHSHPLSHICSFTPFPARSLTRTI